MTDEILWTPSFSSTYDFCVMLNGTFAHHMYTCTLSTENLTKFNGLATNDLQRLGIAWENPYSFVGDTCLVDQVYIGGNGVWLSADRCLVARLASSLDSHPQLRYDSHNVRTSQQLFALQSLFSKWVRYGDILTSLK